VEPQLNEGALVDQQCEALARGQLLPRVLGGDLLLASTPPDLLTPGPEVLGERTQEAGGRGIG
jgi:hypothetical protein